MTTMHTKNTSAVVCTAASTDLSALASWRKAVGVVGALSVLMSFGVLSTAHAQMVAAFPPPDRGVALPIGGPFSTRSGGKLLYSNYTNHPVGIPDLGLVGTCSAIAGDDFTLGSLSGLVAPYTLNAFAFGLYSILPPNPNILESVSIRLSIFSTHTGWQVGTFPGGPTLLGQVNMDFPNFMPQGSIRYVHQPIPFPNNQTIVVPDGEGFAMLEVFIYQSTYYKADTSILGRNVSIANGVPLAGPGSSDTRYWTDCGYNYLVDPGEVPNTNPDRDRGMYLGLSGTGTCAAAPTPAAAIPFPIDGESVVDALQNCSCPVRWYSLDLYQNATDTLGRYLDIEGFFDYEGLALALYSGDEVNGTCGQLIAVDRNSPGSAYAQLTFGIGRRAGRSGHRDFDGRHGQLLAGRYYLAVAAEGSTFGNGYRVVPGAFQAGSYSVNFWTNALDGSLSPSDPPDTIGAPLLSDAGCLQGTNTRGLDPWYTVSDDLAWYRFEVPEITAGTNESLDIDFSFGSSPQAPNATADVFSSAGVRVSHVDRVGRWFSPGPVWGGNTPRYYTVNGEQHIFPLGSTLPAGTYYMAVSNTKTTPAPNHDCFHVRSGVATEALNGDPVEGLYVRPLLFYQNLVGSCTPAGGGNCDSIDFNADGVSPDSLDVEDFLSVFGGGPCSNDPLCGDIDFNNDSVSPDSEDIDALVRVFGGGSC